MRLIQRNRLLSRGPHGGGWRRRRCVTTRSRSADLLHRQARRPERAAVPAGRVVGRRLGGAPRQVRRRFRSGTLSTQHVHVLETDLSAARHVGVRRTGPRDLCHSSRAHEYTPLQALVLLNDPTYVEAARAFAERSDSDHDADDTERLDFGFRSAVARRPSCSGTRRS